MQATTENEKRKPIMLTYAKDHCHDRKTLAQSSRTEQGRVMLRDYGTTANWQDTNLSVTTCTARVAHV